MRQSHALHHVVAITLGCTEGKRITIQFDVRNHVKPHTHVPTSILLKLFVVVFLHSLLLVF